MMIDHIVIVLTVVTMEVAVEVDVRHEQELDETNVAWHGRTMC